MLVAIKTISDLDEQKRIILSQGVLDEAYIFCDHLSGLCDEPPELSNS